MIKLQVVLTVGRDEDGDDDDGWKTVKKTFGDHRDCSLTKVLSNVESFLLKICKSSCGLHDMLTRPGKSGSLICVNALLSLTKRSADTAGRCLAF